MTRFWSTQSPTLTLGSYAQGFPLLPGSLTLSAPQVATHKHLIGVSGTGKSKLLEHMFLSLFRQGVGVSLIDPHADSGEAILAVLAASGYFERSDAYERLLYLEWSDAEDERFFPFNVLQQPHSQPHTIAANVLEAFHRAWPALAEGAAPQFDNLVLAGSLVLIENQLPLTAMPRLLTHKPFRDGLLQQVSDADTVAFFVDRFDKWSRHEAPQMIESTLRRLFLLTFSPVLKYSLGQLENLLEFRRIIDQSQSVIYNLGKVRDQDARRLLGCLITIGYETAALSRGDLEAAARKQHHLLLDEFSDYSAQSEEALSRTLSGTRKYGLFATMAHQTWSQASVRLQGALQNVGVKIALRVGRDDAEILARNLGVVDPRRIKSEAVVDRLDQPRGQPVFLELPAQWEEWIRTLTELPARHALVKVASQRTVHLTTPTVPSPTVDPALLAQVKREYRQRLMRPKPSAQAGTPAAGAASSPTDQPAYTRLFQAEADGRDDGSE